MKRVTVASLCLLLLGACSSRAQFVKRSNTALATSLAATNAARAAFLEWDRHHQAQIVDAATSKEQGKAALADYRKKRGAVVRAFTVAYSSIATAAAVLPLIETGKRERLELVALISAAVEAAANVKRVVDAIRGDGKDEP